MKKKYNALQLVRFKIHQFGKKYLKNLMMVKGYENEWKGVRRPRKNSKDMIL